MDSEIGPTLREARNRRKLDLSEVETAIKIRVRFLRAMENEEWDVLPGGAYTRGFIRTYANYLGLDGERLADDFRRESEGPRSGEKAPKRVEPVPAATKRKRRFRVPRALVIAVVCAGLLALAVAIGLTGGGDDTGGDGSSREAGTGAGAGENTAQRERPEPEPTAPAPAPGVSVTVAADAEVWVCLVDAREEAVIGGEILQEGTEAGPFRSRSFEVALGNGSATIMVDGEPAEVPESTDPLGLAIGPDGDVIALEEGERPDCE